MRKMIAVLVHFQKHSVLFIQTLDFEGTKYKHLFMIYITYFILKNSPCTLYPLIYIWIMLTIKCQLEQQNWNRFAFPYLVKYFVNNVWFYLCLCNCGCCVYLCKSFEVTKLFVWKIDMFSNLKTFQDYICISKQCLKNHIPQMIC